MLISFLFLGLLLFLLLLIVLLLLLFLILLVLLLFLLLLLLLLKFFKLLLHEVAIELRVDVVRVERQSAVVALDRALPELLGLRRLRFAEPVTRVAEIVVGPLLHRMIGRGCGLLESRGCRTEIIAPVSSDTIVVSDRPIHRDSEKQQPVHTFLRSLTNESSTRSPNAIPNGHWNRSK